MTNTATIAKCCSWFTSQTESEKTFANIKSCNLKKCRNSQTAVNRMMPCSSIIIWSLESPNNNPLSLMVPASSKLYWSLEETMDMSVKVFKALKSSLWNVYWIVYCHKSEISDFHSSVKSV